MPFEYKISADDVSAISSNLPVLKTASFSSGVMTVTAKDENVLVKAAIADLPALRLAAFEKQKGDAKRRVDAIAEECRQTYITGGAGQAMTYQQKSIEAVACLANPQPDANDYPLLSAEIGITGDTLVDVATAVKAAFDQWQAIGAKIEAARLTAKAAITKAETADEIHTALDAIPWP